MASFHEKVALYALQCMETLVLGDGDAMEVRPEAYWRYNRLVDERNLGKAWSDPRAHNYYWTEHGRSAVMYPFTAPRCRASCATLRSTSSRSAES